jgi:tRNA pseudouridine38-40 synthase
MMKRNIKITIEFDGTHYCGWQFQPELPTVQNEVEKALFKLVQQPTGVTGAGRTDSGVHATGMVANFLTESCFETGIFLKGLNRFLPLDIRILDAAEVDLDFNARFAAKFRRYEYSISTKKHALNRLYSTFIKYRLDFEAMQVASQYFLGEHDFRSFCSIQADVPHYFSRVFALIWHPKKDEWVMEIVANRFLHNMVRIIVGTLIDVGRGKISPEKIKEILAAKDRQLAGLTAPPQGLTLVEVGYADFYQSKSPTDSMSVSEVNHENIY